MAFVDDLPTRRLDVPDEEGEWFEVRLLSWKDLQACRRASEDKQKAHIRGMDPQLFLALAQIERDTPQAVDQAREANKADVTLDYDPEELVRRSVVGWSYQRHFQPSLMDKLTEPTFVWLYGAILAMYRGDDAQRKADSVTSSTT